MRPNREVVKKALDDTNGNKVKAAILLGCSRETLYKWSSQLGLDTFAGIRRYTPDRIDKAECQDRRPMGSNQSGKSGVSFSETGRGSLAVVAQASNEPLPVQATMKLPEAVWFGAKIEALRRRIHVSDYVRHLIEADLERAETAPRPAKPRKKASESA